MGLFDDVICKYPLALPDANSIKYQTKSLECALATYEIRENGELWGYNPDIEGKEQRGLYFTDDGKRNWFFQSDFTGEVAFYSSTLPTKQDGWIAYSAYFFKGRLQQLHLVSYRRRDGNDYIDLDIRDVPQHIQESIDNIKQNDYVYTFILVNKSKISILEIEASVSNQRIFMPLLEKMRTSNSLLYETCKNGVYCIYLKHTGTEDEKKEFLDFVNLITDLFKKENELPIS